MSSLIYVASRASIPERSAMWRELRNDGWKISSSWIDEAGPGQTASMANLWQRIVEEIRISCGVVLYYETGDLPLKGASVECGMALAMGKPVAIVSNDTIEQVRKAVGSWIEHPYVGLFYSVNFSDAKIWVEKFSAVSCE